MFKLEKTSLSSILEKKGTRPSILLSAAKVEDTQALRERKLKELRQLSISYIEQILENSNSPMKQW